jgi:hypothetical protein
MSTRYKGSVLSATAATNSSSTAVGIWRPNEVMQAVNASLWPLGITYDPYFENVTLLLHGDGTNGAQNNTFLDSSTNNFTITRNGNTTQGTFTPYGSNWSSYFGASTSNRINPPANAAFAFGTGAFTVEAWIFVYDLTAENFVFDTRSSASTAGVGFSIETTTGKLRYSGSANNVLTTTAITANTWNHIAWVYNGTTLTGYINGVSGGTATPAFNITQNNGQIGNVPFSSVSTSAYLSNVRVVKGTAVYTANFTPSTIPLTAITNTSLLTCQNNRFIDNSANNFALTVSGSPSIQRFSPFSPLAAYNTSVIGGSVYFDGSGDYLSLTQPTAMSLGTGDFTVEAWVYPTANPTTFWSIIDARSSVGSVPWAAGMRLVTGNLKATFFNGADIQGSITVALNTWTHIAFARSGTTLKSFVNGVLDINTTMSTNLNVTGSQVIGALQDPAYDTGYISDCRVVKGTAVYTAAFTPPTAPLTAITNTSLLLNYTNAGICDNAMMNDLETVGDAQVSTTQVKFDTGSMKFDGTGDYLKQPASVNLSFGSGDFTLECWAYFTSVANFPTLTDSRVTSASTTGFNLGLSTAKVQIYSTSQILIGATALSANTWYHIAVTRASGTLKIWLNGVQDATVANSTNWSDTTFLVGATPTPTNYMTGYIDDLRVTKGYARYTATFTPPTAAFPNQ